MTPKKVLSSIPIGKIESQIGSSCTIIVKVENNDKWLISGGEKQYLWQKSFGVKEIDDTEVQSLRLKIEALKAKQNLGFSHRIRKGVDAPKLYGLSKTKQLYDFRKKALLNSMVKKSSSFETELRTYVVFGDNEVLKMIESFESDTCFSELLNLTKLPQVTLANEIFELTPKTFAKYRSSSEKVPSRISEQAIKLKELYLKGIYVFGNVDEFNKWIKEPSIGLKERIPLKLLNTATGIDLVNQELLKIEFGVTA